jgi:YVTN family beta-propeller protein
MGVPWGDRRGRRDRRARRGPVALEGPYVVAISPDGTRAYVGLQNGYIQALDTTTYRSLTAIRIDALLVDVLISPDGRRAYVATETSGSPVTVVVIDLATNVIIHTVPIGQDGLAALAMSGDGSRVFVKTENEVVAITTSDDSVSFRKPIEFPRIATAPGAQAYLVSGLLDPVTALDTSGNTTVLPALRRRTGIEAMAGTPEGRHLHLLRNPNETPVKRQVEVVDTATGQVKTSIALSRRPGIVKKMRVSPDGRQLYILQLLNSSVEVIDIADYE